MRACSIFLPSIRFLATCLAKSMGRANATPSNPPPSDAAIPVLIPTTRPCMSVMGPPELPGLMAASVWIDGNAAPAPPSSSPKLAGRLSALTMPVVTEPLKPNGDPSATTGWPIRRLLDEPSVAAGRPDLFATLMTAVSVSGSRPRILALPVVPSLKTTMIEPSSSSAATSTTWLLVRMSPSLLMMMPEPLPPTSPPETLIWTTDGRTRAATCSTAPAGARSSLSSSSIGVSSVLIALWLLARYLS